MVLPPTQPHAHIQEGDLVVVYERFDSMKQVFVKSSGAFDNRFGSFKMRDWIGRPFGCRVHTKPGGQGGWVYLLRPTAELWTQVLKHRTQILYAADISMVCTFLELKPGDTVVESGTGSGSLTTSLARAVGPEGAVHTFEFHQQRCEAAAEDFRQLGLDKTVHLKQRDIEGQGFPADLGGTADGVFLDLPGPWKVVPSAAETLKPNGRFCSFSPCMEQVQQTCLALAANGFHSIRTMECLLRPHEVRTVTLGSGIPDPPNPDNAGRNKKRKWNDYNPKPAAASSKRGPHDRPSSAAAASPPQPADPLQAPPPANGHTHSQPTAAGASPTGHQPTAAGAGVPAPQSVSAAPTEAPTSSGGQQVATPPAPLSTAPAPTAAAVGRSNQSTGSAAAEASGAILQQAFQQQQQQLTEPLIPNKVEDVIHLPKTPASALPKGQCGVQRPCHKEGPSSNNQSDKRDRYHSDQIEVPEDIQQKCSRMVVAQPSSDGRGHTGYLTFAWKSVPVPDL